MTFDDKSIVLMTINTNLSRAYNILQPNNLIFNMQWYPQTIWHILKMVAIYQQFRRGIIRSHLQLQITH